jgi:ribosomal protein S18 acetylase RimI-like enzyme
MGYRPRAPTPDAAGRAATGADATGDELGEAIHWAEARARDRGAKWLEVTLAPALAAARPILRERGWPLVFRQLLLGVDSLAACRWIELEPPSGRAWVDLSEQNLRSAHECYEQALRDVSGATVLPLDEFRSLLSAGQWPMRCLERDGRVIAIARVTWCDPTARVGEVRTIARHPDHAEPKLGRLAMAEALRQLRAAGATSACVEVASDNLLAVGLYRSFGFCDRAISEVYRMVLA